MTFQDGAVTRSVLKRKVGEFDLETIHRLELIDEGITELGCIVECIGLEFLNLSNNEISDISAIGTLGNLHVLNLSCNRLTSLDGLQSCNNLQILNISGNLISCVDDLALLSPCSNLVDLRLVDNIKGWSNPVCLQSDYMEDILTVISSVKMLNGERVRGHGCELYRLCKNIDRAIADAACINGPVREKTLPQKWISLEKGTFKENENLWERRKMLQDTYQELQRDVEKLQTDAEMAIRSAEKYLTVDN